MAPANGSTRVADVQFRQGDETWRRWWSSIFLSRSTDTLVIYLERPAATLTLRYAGCFVWNMRDASASLFFCHHFSLIRDGPKVTARILRKFLSNISVRRIRIGLEMFIQFFKFGIGSRLCCLRCLSRWRKEWSYHYFFWAFSFSLSQRITSVSNFVLIYFHFQISRSIILFIFILLTGRCWIVENRRKLELNYSVSEFFIRSSLLLAENVKYKMKSHRSKF